MSGFGNSKIKQNTYSCRAKKKLLIVEDNRLNQEILTSILEDEYDLLYANDGRSGLDMVAQHHKELSLILLDVYMPVCTGFEFLEQLRGNRKYDSIFVIVTTSSEFKDDEVRCLNLGATDFITKPYKPNVVRGRIRNFIRMADSIATLTAVECDSLTNLYTISAFAHHADLALRTAVDGAYDLLMLDIKSFKLVNSIYGDKLGDATLQMIARSLQKLLPDAIMARRGDKMYALMQNGVYEASELAETLYEEIKKQSPISNLNMKFGVYKHIDKRLAVSAVCDRAAMAIGEIPEDSLQYYAEYTSEVAERIQAEQLMLDHFEEALQTDELVPWFQPKVDVTTEQIVGAEALSRWMNADGSMIMPNSFIPLLERNGKISSLDCHIFKKVCRFQAARLAEGKPTVPISVNLSRNSIFHPNIEQEYERIVEETGVPKSLVPIELTESAAVESDLIRTLTEKLQRLHFLLQIDDFGTGCSSLMSLTTLPFSVMKLDKSLVDTIGDSKGNKVVRHVLSLAQDIGMKVVAEGVERQEQVRFLREVGCDEIQGYYYSPPKSQAVFEQMLDTNTLQLKTG